MTNLFLGKECWLLQHASRWKNISASVTNSLPRVESYPNTPGPLQKNIQYCIKNIKNITLGIIKNHSGLCATWGTTSTRNELNGPQIYTQNLH